MSVSEFLYSVRNPHISFYSFVSRHFACRNLYATLKTRRIGKTLTICRIRKMKGIVQFSPNTRSSTHWKSSLFFFLIFFCSFEHSTKYNSFSDRILGENTLFINFGQGVGMDERFESQAQILNNPERIRIFLQTFKTIKCNNPDCLFRVDIELAPSPFHDIIQCCFFHDESDQRRQPYVPTNS